MMRPGSAAEPLDAEPCAPPDAEPCPPEAEILAFVGGETRASGRGVGAHLEVCDECRRLVSLLADRGDAGGGSGRSGPELLPGDVVAGKYEIVSEIGRGGMGVVFKANHLTLGQYVALKFLAAPLSRDAGAIARLFREARAVAALGSEHVVRVLDAARLPSGEPYLVLEFLEGLDLGATLREHGPLPIAKAVDYVLGACEALALAHRSGIVHRDIKPSNLFLTTGVDGTPLVKVLDFGVVKVRAAAARSIDATDPASIIGSPRYMPPEQLQQGADVDARADVWALAVTLFELLTGRAPFEGSTLLEVCAAIASTPPARLRALRPDAPEPLAAALERAITKDREERTPTIEAFAAAIAPHASGDVVALVARIRRIAAPVTVRVHRASLPPHGESSDGISSTLATPVLAEPSPRRRLAAILSTGLVAMIAGVAWLVLGAPRSIAPEAPRTSAAAVAPSLPSSEPPREDATSKPQTESLHDGAASGPKPQPPAEPSANGPRGPAPAPLAHKTVLPESGPRPRSLFAGASSQPAAEAPRAADPAPAMSSNPLHRDGLLDRK